MTDVGPLLFQPWLRPMPWGGDKLAQHYQPDHHGPLGEAWLLSDHSLHQSVVCTGEFAGKPLPSLIADYPQELGLVSPIRFPLLIKILHAQMNLSVQVHPDDRLARTWAPKEGGKTEAWTILEASEDAKLYLGIPDQLSGVMVERHLREQTLVEVIEPVPAKPGSTYYVPAGTVHAMGQGVLALEVQQTSDATFRLYDWGRVDAQGQPRALHLDAGLACIQHRPEAGLQQPVCFPESGWEVLVQSPYFRVRRATKEKVTVDRPCIIITWQGDARINNYHLSIPDGYACLMPKSPETTTIQLDNGTVLFEIVWPLAE
jgi:mannose-6-phosphate isomerase